MRVNLASVNLRGFLERMREEFRPAAHAKGLELTLRCLHDAMVDTDRTLLERIVRNLLDNAIKYTDKGSICMEVSRQNGAYTMSVRDTGRGIHEAEQARVFEEFYQVDNPERDRTKGLGLGLAIVKRLTDLLRIRMDMTSRPGEGTQFRLTMRAAESAQDALAEAAPADARPIAAHVLVVDDELEIRIGMRTLLEQMGCRATLADSTQAAVAAAREAKPDLVLADFRLRKGDDGITAVRAVRALYPSMPAILVSGDIAADRLLEAEKAGITLLHKPVPGDTLKRAIAEAVEA
jgi:CheY-like chemotaxis protein